MNKNISSTVKGLIGRAVIAVMVLQNFAFFAPAAQAAISDGMNASDLLGQYGDTICSTQTPLYTSGISYIGTNQYGFNHPSGLAIDSVNHRLFVTDSNNSRVLVYNLTVGDDLVDRIADNVLGQPDFVSSGTATTQAGMYSPHSLAYDSANDRLFVLDSQNQRVLSFDVATITDGESAANVLGQPDFVSSGTATTQAGMNFPYGLAYDSANDRLFVGDIANSRVLSFDVATITDGESAANVLGQPDFVSSGAATTQSGMSGPRALAYDSANDRLFVGDSDNSRVLSFDVASITDGENAANVLGQPDFVSSGTATTQAGMYYPRALAYDSANDRLFVADHDNNRVLSFDVASITDGENAANVLGQPDFVSSGTAITQAGMSDAFGLAYDSANDRLFVADFSSSRVLSFDVTSITDGENATDLLGQYGDTICSTQTPLYTASGLNGRPNQYGFSVPTAPIIDSVNHRLFVADSGNSRVLVYNLTAGDDLIDRIADNVLGQPGFASNNEEATQSGMINPGALAYDSANDRLFVADSYNHRVLSFDVASITDGENAANVLGQPDFVTNASSTTQAGMFFPFGLAYDSTNDRLFVADKYNGRVLSFDVASITDGENAANVLGQPDFVTNASSTTQSRMSDPFGLAYDSANDRLFVADHDNRRVLSFDVASITDGENAANVLGQPDFVSSGAATTQSGMFRPRGLAYDSANDRLFVADSYNHRTLSFDVASITDGENAANVLGQPDFVTNTATVTQSSMIYPFGLAYDSANDRLFVADTNSNRVLIFDDVAPAAPTNDATLSNKVLQSRLKVGVSSDVTILFTLQNTLSGVLTVTFPAGFTVTSDPTSGGSSACLGTFGHTAQTAFATKTACSGAILLGGFTVTNPGTVGSYLITWVNDDPGEAIVAIVDDDQVTVSATVDPTITFDLDTGIAAGETAAPYTVALGSLTTGAVNRSDNSTINSIYAQLATNATSGALVTVLSANAALVSASVPGDTIPNAAGTMAAATANYGICVNTVTAPTASAGAFNPAAPYNAGTCDPAGSANAIKALSTVTPTIILTSASAPVTGGAAEILVNAAISTATAAHSDYSDTLTFVATGTF